MVSDYESGELLEELLLAALEAYKAYSDLGEVYFDSESDMESLKKRRFCPFDPRYFDRARGVSENLIRKKEADLDRFAIGSHVVFLYSMLEDEHPDRAKKYAERVNPIGEEIYKDKINMATKLSVEFIRRNS